MRSKRSSAIAAALAAAALVIVPRGAQAQEPEQESVAMRANRGLAIGIAPTLLFPSRENGPYGVGLELAGRYGFRAGPTVIAPGAMVGGYTISSRFIGDAMPTLLWTLPVGFIAPYLVGGVGAGWLSNPGEGGVALLGGGGLTVHFGSVAALGLELTYRSITGTERHGLALGPTISFGG
jgi:hypothetical protein